MHRLTDKTLLRKQTRPRKVSKAGKAAMAASGRANLTAWRAAQDVDAQRVRELTAEFEGRLRQEIGPDASVLGLGFIESAIASYRCMAIVSLKLSIGSQRLDRIRELHGLLVESQRNLYRVLRALQIDGDRPAAREARRERVLARVRGDIAGSRAENAPNVEKGTSDAENTQGSRVVRDSSGLHH
jgi:hypothetical protein